jgi:hypothetical protein
VLAPSLWSTSWRCESHGDVAPLHAVAPVTGEAVRVGVLHSRVPVWLLWPLPPGWLVTGIAWAGDERAPAVASAVALSGPALVGGPADLVLVAEEPGVGVASGLAGRELVDPDPSTMAGPPATRVATGGRPAPLWSVPTAGPRSGPRSGLTAGPSGTVSDAAVSNAAVSDAAVSDAAVYAGEAAGCWLWALAWPSETGLELYDGAELVDLRDPGHPLDLPFGAASPRLPH